MADANEPRSGGLSSGRVTVARPARPSLAAVVSCPHSGRDYDPAFLALARLDEAALRRSEDAFVDDLVAGVPALGAPLVTARFPRCYLDVNRDPAELDPDMFDGRLPYRANGRSPRVRAGLGVLPRVVRGGAQIHRGKLAPREAGIRFESCYLPYHDVLAELLRRTRDRFGAVALIDCHSMPTATASAGMAGARVDAVLGDRFGTSCARGIARAAAASLRRDGLRVRRNDPYPGGFITEHYGRPRLGLHALQVEISRDLYMDEKTLTRGPGMGEMARSLERLVVAVADAARTVEHDADGARGAVSPRAGRGVVR